jgi:hypothetical protein
MNKSFHLKLYFATSNCNLSKHALRFFFFDTKTTNVSLDGIKCIAGREVDGFLNVSRWS